LSRQGDRFKVRECGLPSEYHDNQRVIAESLPQEGALQPGLDIDRASDILWTINHPDV
jgi:hypothetical protein